MSERRYGVWSGDLKGTAQNVLRCVSEVFAGEGFARYYGRQCTRPRGHGPDGLYCKQHARKIAERGKL
jgi:hypothetical protein